MGNTYNITSFTGLNTDMDHLNDTISAQVTNLFPADIGITEVITPVSGINLNDDEEIIVLIQNFGGEAQSNFEVSYTLDGQPPVIEMVSASVNATESMEFSFSTPGDFSAFGDHELIVKTLLDGDANSANDEITVYITKTLCAPQSNCSFGVGIMEFQLGEIENLSGCDIGGYGDYTNLTATLVRGNEHTMTITAEYGDTHLRAWLDLNQDGVFDPEEIIVNDFIIGEGQGSGTFTESVAFFY